MSLVSDNLRRVQAQIAVAAERSGRDPSEITVVAVTKTKPVELAREAFIAGTLNLGENYVQEAVAKRDALPEAHWHFLGHLQTNKAKAAVQTFDLIQSVDSVKLAQTLGRNALAIGKTQAVLLQVHLGDEATKFGLLPQEVLETADVVSGIAGLELKGLMGIAPNNEDPIPYFRQLRGLWEHLPQSQRQILSMGMTGDFEAAIAEGTTMLRIGTAIFGSRA